MTQHAASARQCGGGGSIRPQLSYPPLQLRVIAHSPHAAICPLPQLVRHSILVCSLLCCAAIRMQTASSVTSVPVGIRATQSTVDKLALSASASTDVTISSETASAPASALPASPLVAAPSLLPPMPPPPQPRARSSRPLRRRQATPTVRMAARNTSAAASTTSCAPPAALQQLVRADTIEAAQQLADRQEREQAKMSPAAERPSRTHHRVASGRENVPPPSMPLTARERAADAPTMYDHIKRKTACYNIEQTNSGVRLTATSAPPTTQPQPLANTAQRTPTLPPLPSTTIQQREDKKEDEEAQASKAHTSCDTSRDSLGAIDDGQPGAAQPPKESKRVRRRSAGSEPRSSGRKTTLSINKKQQQHGTDEADRGEKAIADGRHSSPRSRTSTARDNATQSGARTTRAANSKKATSKTTRQSQRAFSSPVTSPSPPPLSSPQLPLFRLPVSDQLYLAPTLASAPLSDSSTAAVNPFSTSFHATLSAADKPTFVRYLVAAPEDVLHRVRYILRRDNIHQNHLARCLNISPATLSPMLRGVYDHLKTKHLSMMRAWAAQMDVRYVQHVVSAIRVWVMDEADWSRECNMTLADIKRWLLFDMTLSERNEADRAIARWMNEHKNAADMLVNEAVMRQFEADYVNAVHDGQLDEWRPAAIVKTSELDSVQHDKDDEAAKLDEDDRKGTDVILFNIPTITTNEDSGIHKKSARRTTKSAQLEAEELGDDREEDGPEEREEKWERRRSWKQDDGEASLEVVGRHKKKRKRSSQQQEPLTAADKRVKVEATSVASTISVPSPASAWNTRPATSVDSFGVARTPMSFLNSVTRLDGNSKASTFFYFDANADMSQLADKWSLPAIPVLPTFTSLVPSTAELSSTSSSASAYISSVGTPAAASSSLFCGRSVFGSPNVHRVSSASSESSSFTPTTFLATRTPSSSTLTLSHPSAVFFTPVGKAADSSLMLDESKRASTSGSPGHNSSLSSLSIHSLSSLLPTPANVTNSSTDTVASINSAMNNAHNPHDGVNKDDLPLARQLNLSDEDDASKQQAHSHLQQAHHQQHYANQQLEFTHAILSMSAGSPMTHGKQIDRDARQ